MNVIYLSLGSNIGDSKGYLLSAIGELKKADLSLLAVSRLYQTKAVGYTEQDDFLNIAVKIETKMSADQLLSIINHIEQTLGRKRLIHWGPRTIDIDIIWQEGFTSDSERLTIPHPRAFERAFVVLPMLDLTIEDKQFLAELNLAKEKTKAQEIAVVEEDLGVL